MIDATETRVAAYSPSHVDLLDWLVDQRVIRRLDDALRGAPVQLVSWVDVEFDSAPQVACFVVIGLRDMQKIETMWTWDEKSRRWVDKTTRERGR